MNKKRFGIFFALIAILLSMVIMFSSCSPVKLTKIKADKINQNEVKYAGDSFHKVKRSAYEFICKSGLIEMYFDKATCTVAILDTSANTFWSTLPLDTESKSLSFSALEVTLSNGSNTEYKLNSQDNAVAFGTAQSEVTKNGVTVKYSLALDEGTSKAPIEELKNAEIRADITVTYSLIDGSFYTSVSMNNVHLPKGVILEKVKLLDSFGTCSNASKDDFLFIPDGSGALIKTGIEDKEFSPISLAVYGNDAGISNGGVPALFGAFGVKHQNGAFLCIIESGDTIATINATRSSETSLNTVNAEFNITDQKLVEGKSKDTKTLGYTFNGEIRLCYRFLSGKSATYSGMAAACRENMIRNSVISSKTVNTDSAILPLIVNIQFGYYNEKGKLSVKSSFAQAKDLLALLKAKGVNSVYVRANGVFKNANQGTQDEFGSFIKQLGSKDDYATLYSYLKTQNFPLYLDTDILTFEKNSKDGAKNINGKKSVFTENSTLINAPTKKQQFLPLAKLEGQIDNLLYKSASLDFDGFALNDMGKYLYSDYSSDFYPRESSKIELASQLSVLTSYKSVMIDTGNFYSIKNADIITNLPYGTLAKEENNAYCAIPFVELLLHGTYDYSTGSINLSDDMKTTFLRSIEYGCLLSADWYCANTSKDDKYGYNNNINDIVSYSVKANDILGDLRDARMTSHYEVKDGVYCTEYNNSSKVYVNYTESNVKVNGITVNAKDCVKVS